MIDKNKIKMSSKNEFTIYAIQKYPYIDGYINDLKIKGITEEKLNDEINLLNKCSLCKDPITLDQRFKIAFFSSLNPTPILGGVIQDIIYDDQCEIKYREAEVRYKSFYNNILLK